MGSCVSVSVSFSRFTCEPLLLLLLLLGSTVQCHQIQSQSVQTAFSKMVQDQQYIVLNAVMKRHILRVYHPSLILIKQRNKKILPGFLFFFSSILCYLFFFLRCHLPKSEEQLPAASIAGFVSGAAWPRQQKHQLFPIGRISFPQPRLWPIRVRHGGDGAPLTVATSSSVSFTPLALTLSLHLSVFHH